MRNFKEEFFQQIVKSNSIHNECAFGVEGVILWESEAKAKIGDDVYVIWVLHVPSS